MKELQSFAWAILKEPITWKNVEALMNKLDRHNLYDSNEHASNLHIQFGHVRNYCTVDKIKQWKDAKVSAADRWVEIFKHLDKESCEYNEIGTIIEYILCLPGSTASVERVFSAMNKTWTDEKTNLQIETLKAILTVKCNMKLSCIEFLKYIQTKPELLRPIASSNKYTKTVEGDEDADDSDKSNESEDY